MTYLLTILALVSFDFSDISKINSLKKEAENSYLAGNFDKAISSYHTLLDTMGVEDDKATLNLAHAYLQKGEPENAQKHYQKLVLSKDKKLKSIAYQQLGNLSSDPKTLERALSFFKESIKSDPTNEDARYNYEVVKKKLENQKDQNQDDQNKENNENKDDQKDEENKENKDDKSDQEQKDQKEQNEEENKEEKNEDQKESEEKSSDESKKEEEEEEQMQEEQKEEEGKDEPSEEQKEGEEKKEGEENNEEKDEKQPPQPSTADKLEKMNLTEEKAKMILEALKNSEIQYIQQNQRRPTKKKDSGKPDW